MNPQFTAEYANKFAEGTLPAHLNIRITEVGPGLAMADMEISSFHLAPNGFLHAGSVVTLADTACGLACYANLPEGASNFTTVELKSNHLGTAREGAITVVARAVHMGRTTQVWDATVTDKSSGKTIALFRCTQMILYPKA
ncbi:PaaI family thioesterase [Pseudoduganella sp. UC29_106]|uniref:PaaI family thioesterase n=1 Tax=Pseudoduganella sp. UC29_106 TaxID=3374553 RepID=UPI0037563761